MYSADADQKTTLHIEGVRVPCRDANRRVWQAIDLLIHEHNTRHNNRPRTAASARQQSSPSSKEKKENPPWVTIGGI
jgi:hypothetical protein